MKESLAKIDQKCIFKETFSDEATTRANGGIPSNVTYQNGIGSFNGTSSYVPYNLPLKGTYSFRIIGTFAASSFQKFLVDLRTNSGTGFLSITNSSIDNNGGTRYINGSTGTSVPLTKCDIVISGFTTTATILVFGCRYQLDVNTFLGGSIELLEIYSGSLTASECALLYSNKTYKEPLLKSSTITPLLNLSAFKGALRDSTGLRTLTPINVSINRIGNTWSPWFNGTTSLLNTGSEWIGTKSITCAVWFRADSFGTVAVRIISNNKFLLYLNPASPTLYCSSDATNILNSAANTVSLGKWTFIALTRKSDGKTSLYVGTLSDAPALSGSADQNGGTPVAGSENVIIGNRVAADRGFAGYIPMVRIYEGILSLEQLTNIWSSTKGKL